MIKSVLFLADFLIQLLFEYLFLNIACLGNSKCNDEKKSDPASVTVVCKNKKRVLIKYFSRKSW